MTAAFERLAETPEAEGGNDMYTAQIGQSVIDQFNRSEGAGLSAREYFDERIFPVFFDDERFLMNVGNSPFFQAYIQKKKKPLDAARRLEVLEDLHAKIAASVEPQMHLYLGGPAAGVDFALASQVTDLPLPLDSEIMYRSWVGFASAVTVEGGWSILIDHPLVLSALSEGWPLYRRLMAQTAMLKPHQVGSWNAHWLHQRFHPRFDSDDPLAGLPATIQSDGSAAALETLSWVRLIFSLARRLPDETLVAYVFKLGKTNQTLGFVRFDLPPVASMLELARQLFGSQGGLAPHAIEDLYQTQFGFQMACRQGSIGLRALEPQKLRPFMPNGSEEGSLPKPPTEKTDLQYRIYELWMIAMLNNEKLIQLADETAKALHRASAGDKRGKTTHGRKVEEALKAANRRKFIEGLTEIVRLDRDNADLYDNLVLEVMRMSPSDFPLLLTLIRFKYARQAS